MPPGRAAAGRTEELVDAVRGGDRRALARAITLIESTRADHRGEAASLLAALLPHAGASIRLGVSGVPGVGKSTFIEALGRYVIGLGHRVAVLAVDPSSQRTGGSILGDKTRMTELARDPAAFIRPSPAAGTLGGVARRTREAIIPCESAGFDVVLVETVGVGQSETAVADMVDLFVLLVLPGSGDELQGLKKGIVELADLVLINKADGVMADAARAAVAEYRHALAMLRPPVAGWRVPVESCSSLSGEGIAEAWRIIERYRDMTTASGALPARRAEQARAWLWTELREGLLAALSSHPEVRAELPAVEAQVVRGEATPSAAADALLRRFLR